MPQAKTKWNKEQTINPKPNQSWEVCEELQEESKEGVKEEIMLAFGKEEWKEHMAAWTEAGLDNISKQGWKSMKTMCLWDSEFENH